MEMTEEQYLAHYGVLRRSGRYPWGSGKTQNQRNKTFLDIVDDHKKAGMSDTEIAKAYGLTRIQLQALRSHAKAEQKQDNIRTAERLRDKGVSVSEIGRQMGLNESSVRALLDPSAKEKADILQATSEMLKRQVEEKGYVDIGAYAHHHVGISETKFKQAVAILEEQGYVTDTVFIPQAGGSGNFTTNKALAAPGTTRKQFLDNKTNIRTISERTVDNGKGYDEGFKTPINISSRRLDIKYAEQGGTKADGLIYVRPGASELSLGGKQYAQVRIAIDGTHYIKGMAVYKDDLPKGVDLQFNTNKSDTGNKKDALKKMEDDPDLPFGSVVRQLKDNDHNVTSAMNIVNDEGDWDRWAKNLPSQFLSKQSNELVKKQLDKAYDDRKKEFDEISALTNPVVKRKLLKSFSDETDSAAVKLRGAKMPRQATKVLIPIQSIKESEVYAPSFPDGTRLALVRFPHGGTFEIPQVTVNNKNREARKIIGTGKDSDSIVDAIGIHHKVAERLSGADFDGDTVLAIPNNGGLVKSTPALEGLKGFDPKLEYRPYDGLHTVDGGVYDGRTRTVNYGVDKDGKPKRPNTGAMQQKMGSISNLITDMTVRGASDDELARAVRHSMVVIDCEKHHLDFRKSHINNGIAALKEKYQGSAKSGATTIISRARSETRIDKRRPRPASEGGPIDKKTGKLVFVPKGKPYVDKKGQTKYPQEKHDLLAVTDDAHTISSGKPVEKIYANHSNRLKDLANQARKEMVNNTTPRAQSKSAKKVYSAEVASLNAKLNVAQKNAPLERQAQRVARANVDQKKEANPHLEKKDIKKIEGQEIAKARSRLGSRKILVDITPREWEAIQAGAISTDKLEKIMQNGDLTQIRQYATPRAKKLMTSSKQARAKAMLAQGKTQAEVADALGVSLTTLKNSLGGG